ncbi:MAG: phosphoglucosamine mutase [Candidatus Saliniplasma sp.]
MQKLFGTNGVRGIVNQDMTVDLALRLGKAIGTWLEQGTVAIGTDTRLSNQMLKNAVCSALNAAGCDVIDLGEAPTPAIQMYTRDNTDLGIAITASHNPPQFNGIKCIDSDGTELIRWKEEEIEKLYFTKKFDLAEWSKVGEIRSDDATGAYMDAVKSNVDRSIIEEANLKVIVDCANGAGCYSTPYILKDLGCDVITLNAQPDGTFPGHESEPTEKNLRDLIRLVKETDADIGIANDGDADRAIFIDENGRYLHGDKTLTLMAKTVVQENEGGTVVTPVSSSTSVEDVVKDAGGELIYTRVGSPIVAREMIEKGALFGGEENGGLIFAEHQYCRDAGLTAAKIVEMVAAKGPLSKQVDELPSYALDKRGVSCPDEMKDELMKQLKKRFEKEDFDDTDGLKIYYENGWVLIRPSGTEPKYRVYSQAKEKDTAEELGRKHQKIVKNVLKKIR